MELQQSTTVKHSTSRKFSMLSSFRLTTLPIIVTPLRYQSQHPYRNLEQTVYHLPICHLVHQPPPQVQASCSANVSELSSFYGLGTRKHLCFARQVGHWSMMLPTHLDRRASASLRIWSYSHGYQTIIKQLFRFFQHFFNSTLSFLLNQ